MVPIGTHPHRSWAGRLPPLVEEPGVEHLRGPHRVTRAVKVDRWAVGQLRDLVGVVEQRLLAKCDAAVARYVAPQVERVREVSASSHWPA